MTLLFAVVISACFLSIFLQSDHSEIASFWVHMVKQMNCIDFNTLIKKLPLTRNR